MTAEIPKPRPAGTVPEDQPILRELPDGFIWFQYSISPRVGRSLWLDPIFWQGPTTNAWVGTTDGKVPEGTAVFASRAQAKDAMLAALTPPRPQDAVEQTSMF